jgi:hypothetical protein
LGTGNITTGNLNSSATGVGSNGGAITLSTAGGTITTGNINSSGAVNGGDINLTGPVIFNAVPTTVTSGAGGGNINFNNTVAGASDLTVTAGTGNITFVGAVAGLTGLTTTAANTNVANNITTTGDITFNSPVTLNDSSSKLFSAGTGAIAFNNTISAGTNNLTLNADEINLPSATDSVSGTGNLFLEPQTPSRSITHSSSSR